MGLYRLIEFMMIDKDGSGTINMDEVCETFRRRYGMPLETVLPRALCN